MGTINVANLIFKLQQKIDETSNEADILYYAKAIRQLKSAQVFVVNLVSDLPNFKQVLNSLYFVLEDESLYFASPDGWFPIFEKNVNSLFVWGGNAGFGKLANGTLTASTVSPVREISSSANWCYVSLGSNHAVGIKTDGSLWSWGNGSGGRLGNLCTVIIPEPTQEFNSATNWCQASAANYNSTAVKTNGTLWTWGCNICGQIGDGTVVTTTFPVQEITSSTNWCQAAAGRCHTGGVKQDGSIWKWGRNNYGQLGDGTTVPKCSPVREIASATTWCQLSSASHHNVALSFFGTVWTWGRNNYGQLGDGTTVNKCSPVRERSSSSDWCQVAAGDTNMGGIKVSGQLWTWGSGFCGILGDGSITAKCSPVREITLSTNWCQVAVGRIHFSAIKTDGTLWAWGCNSGSSACVSTDGGQLGDGTTICRCSAVREISSSTDWILTSSGSGFTAGIKSRII